MGKRQVEAYGVKVYLNDLAWDNPAEHSEDLAEIERLAVEADGYMRGAGAEILYGHNGHFLAYFVDLPYAVAYQSKVLEKPYVGRAAIEPHDGRRVIEQMPPAELMQSPNRPVNQHMAAAIKEARRKSRRHKPVPVPEINW